MKITAEFDSIDSAELTASTIRHNLSNKTFINVKSNNTYNIGNNRTILFSNFNTTNTTPTFTFYNNRNDYNNVKSYQSDITGDINKATIEIICKKQDFNTINHFIINHGGRNISKI